jgi:hypothetical protein
MPGVGIDLPLDEGCATIRPCTFRQQTIFRPVEHDPHQREIIMGTFKAAAALAVAGAISLSSLQAVTAAPLTPLSASAKPAVEDQNTVQVRYGGWHGGGWGAGIGAGLLAGAVIGSAIAAPGYYGGYAPYYGGYGYASYPYGYGGYYPAYAYRPYYGYGYAPRRVYRSYGYYGVRPWRHSYGYYRGPGWGQRWHGGHFGHHHGVIRTHHHW